MLLSVDRSSTMTTIGHRKIILSDRMPGYASGQTILSRAVQSLCLFMSVLLSSQDVITRTFSCAALETIRREGCGTGSHTRKFHRTSPKFRYSNAGNLSRLFPH